MPLVTFVDAAPYGGPCFSHCRFARLSSLSWTGSCVASVAVVCFGLVRSVKLLGHVAQTGHRVLHPKSMILKRVQYLDFFVWEPVCFGRWRALFSSFVVVAKKLLGGHCWIQCVCVAEEKKRQTASLRTPGPSQRRFRALLRS